MATRQTKKQLELDISSGHALQKAFDVGEEPSSLSTWVTLGGGERTKIHIMTLPRHLTAARVAMFDAAEPLVHWCDRLQIHYAVSGGFFLRTKKKPLGETWMRGLKMDSLPWGGRWADKRTAIHFDGDSINIAPLGDMPKEPTGDLITAGPGLVRDGQVIVSPDCEFEGLEETWKEELDDNWTHLRAARNAVGYDEHRIWSVVSDGPITDPVWAAKVNAPPAENAGLYLWEMAEILARLGATDAINLDGGGGTTQVFEQRVTNKPIAGKYDTDFAPGAPLTDGRPIYTAIAFLRR